MTKDFHGDLVVKNPPANARDTGSIPDPGRFHMPGAAKLMHHNFSACVFQSLCSTRKATAMRRPALQLESSP